MITAQLFIMSSPLDYATRKWNTLCVLKQPIWYTQPCKLQISPDTAGTPQLLSIHAVCSSPIGITQLPADSYLGRQELSWKACCFLSCYILLLRGMTVPVFGMGRKNLPLGFFLAPTGFHVLIFKEEVNLRQRRRWCHSWRGHLRSVITRVHP